MSHDHDTSGTKGQVSETADMSGTPDPIDPSDATAGQPEGESGHAEEGEAGPDAAPADNVESNET